MAVSQLPALVSLPHPMVVDQRDVSFVAFLDRETIGAYIERTGVRIAKGPVAVWHNGYRVPDELWTRLIPRAGDQIVIRARVQGGGGGNKVLRTVALIAVVVISIVAPYLAPAAWGATATVAGVTTVTAVGAAISAAVLIGGSMLVNSLIPLPKPNMAKTSAGSVDNTPAFQIQASRNSPRPWEPMILVMGRHKVVPDLASNPSTSYVGDNQYLAQAFHFGLQPDLQVSDIRIGDTPITDYQGVDIQRSGWDGALTLVPDNVDTLQGFDINFADSWNSRTTPLDTVHVEVELAAVLFSLNTETGQFNPRPVVVEIEYRPVGGTTWTPVGVYSNPVYATHYWALGIYQADSGDTYHAADWVQQSYGSTNFADHVDGDNYQVCQTNSAGDAGETVSCLTFEWRWLPHPYQLGRPWQGIAPDPLIGSSGGNGVQMVGISNKVVRVTTGFHLPIGQYDVRVRKITPDINTNTDSNVTSVTQIRAYQQTPTDYSGQLRYGVRIRATSQLNGAIDELSAICEASCSVWTGTEWVWKPTRNPAWWFFWFALGARDADGNRLYGGGISSLNIDFDNIKAWAAYCDAKGWTFDYVLAQKTSVHDMLTMIARAGQASYTWQSGGLGVIWDAADLPVVAMIGPYNIKSGTFEVSYVDSTVDSIVGNFINSDRDWEADQVRVSVPGAPVLNNPQTFDLEGTTSAAVAGRMVNLVAASQIFHRRRVSWEMDIEGYIATRGDVVQVSHDLTVWGYAGRLKAGDRSTLTLDRDVPIGGSGWLALRGPENQMAMLQVAGTGDTDTLTILNPAALASFPMPGEAGYEDVVALDWVWQFDPLQTPGRRLKIVHVEPTNDEGVRFEAVDDDPNYYNSENNPFLYTPPRDGSLLRGIIFALSFEETIVNVQGDLIDVRLDWVASAASSVNIDYTINGKVYPTIATTDRYAIIEAHTGDVIRVTVTPVTSTGKGVAKSGSWTVSGLLAPLPAVTGLTSVFRDGLTVLKWEAVQDIRDPDYEIRTGSSWVDSRTVAITPSLEVLAIGNGLYFVAARFVTSKGQVVYGPADSLSISGATLVRNVLLTYNEDPAWTGTVSDGAFIFGDALTLVATGDILDAEDVLALDDVLWYGGVSNSGVYQTAESNVVDIGYVAAVRVDFTIDAFALNFSENVLSIEDILSYDDVLNASNQQHYTIQPQIRTATAEGEWSDWANYVPGLLNARYFDVRVVLTTDNPLIVPFVEHFSWTIDVPDLVQQAEEVAVPDEGLHVDFPKAFHAKPNVQITQLDAVNGDRFTLTNVTLTGFDIYFFNGTTPKAAVMNYIAQRY